jgi:hypothetical protein
MAKLKINGVCRICGTEGELSKEHFPPQKANNKDTFFASSMEEVIDGVQSKGIQMQGGISGYTLCERCNKNTGRWYGTAFIDFSKSIGELLNNSDGMTEIELILDIYPLRIIKQIVSMFLSVQNDDFSDEHIELRNFVLNTQINTLDAKYRFFVYCCNESPTHQYRRNPFVSHTSIENLISRLGNIQKTQTNRIELPTTNTIQISEISHPPLGIVMTIDSIPKDKRLLEITDFATYDFDDEIPFSESLPLLVVSNPIMSGIYD